MTAVLIGQETWERDYVAYEIAQSIARGTGILGIRIHKVRNLQGKVDDVGQNPLSSAYPVYLWNKDDGYSNFGSWVEKAAKAAGK